MFRIEKITEDTLILRRGVVTFVYVKSKDQKTEAHYATNNNIKVRIQRHGTERQLFFRQLSALSAFGETLATLTKRLFLRFLNRKFRMHSNNI